MPRIVPLKYSGVRRDEYETAKIFYGSARRIPREDIEDLNRREKRALKDKERRAKLREQKEAEEAKALAAKIAAELAASEAKRKARQARQNEKRKLQRMLAKVNVVADIKVGKITDDDVFYADVFAPVSKACEKLIGQSHAYLQVSQDSEVVVSELIEITKKTGASIFWDDIKPYIIRYADGEMVSVFDSVWNSNEYTALADNASVRLVLIKADAVPAARIQQHFRDGAVHCVIEPLYMLWKQMSDNSESEASKKRCMQIARRIKSLEAVYPNGVPEDKMDEVAKIANRCIIIHDIIGNEIVRYNKKSSMYFHFTNTRAHHIDTGFITLDKKYESVSQDEMNKILYEHDQANEFYLFTGDFKSGIAQSLRSAKGAWAVFNKDHDLFVEFSQSVGVPNYGIDAVKYSALNEFVKEARIINSAPTPLCDEPNDIEGAQHLDIEKAYTQHAKCKYYKGFLGHIQQWRSLPYTTDAAAFLDTHTGIFQFVVLNTPNELLTKLGIMCGKKYTLPSPEIEYFMDKGLQVRLIAGCWGSTFDIEYTPEMLDNRRYCMWAGKLGMDKDVNVYTFKGNRDWAAHLKTVLGEDNVLYFSNEGIIIVKVAKSSYFTTHHILAFITSYTRLNMFEVMEKIDGELIKVVLDGIYYRGEVQDVSIPHKTNKDMVKHLGFRDCWYYPSTLNVSDWAAYNKDLDGSCVLAGAGGTGKSFSVLTDAGFVNPLYVVPSHLLGRKCREKYGCSYTTINKLIGMECRPYKEQYREPGVVFIDELTMIEGEWIEKAIAMHPNTLFFIAGDIDEKQWYQCRNGHPGAFSKVWIPGNEWRYVYYTNDMRSKDQELRDMKTNIRNYMKDAFTDGGQFDARIINKCVKSRYQTVKFDDAANMFVPGDIWIAGTHKTNNNLLERGIVSGYINKNKEIVAEEEVGAEKRGSFTTHSFQGLTIETQRVFISLDFFEYAMLYTSISRVRNFNQIVLVA